MTGTEHWAEPNLTDIDSPPDNGQSLPTAFDRPQGYRLDLEELVEKVATVAGVGLLVVSLLFGWPGGLPDPPTPAARQTLAANVRGAPSPIQKVSQSTRIRRKYASQPRPIPELPLWESPLHARIVVEKGTMSVTGYVLRSCLAHASVAFREGDSVSVRCDRRITYCANGDPAGELPSGTVGTVLKVADDEISIRFSLPRPLDRVRLKRWHVQPVTGQGDIQPGAKAIISAQGGASMIDEERGRIGIVADGVAVLLINR